MAPYFRLQWKIDAVEEQGVDIPMMNDRKNFCLSYHFKGVCNLHCGGRHPHRTMSQAEMGKMSTWKDRFCGADSASPIQTVDAGYYGSVVSASTALTTRSRWTRRGRGGSGRYWQRSPEGFTEDMVAVKG